MPKKMFTTVTIGDIADERARELYLEEWRQPELTRISWCLARSGQPDEWGETYNLSTWDKQSGTDLNGGSYWYKRTTRYNIFNHGPIVSNKELNYQVDSVICFGRFPTRLLLLIQVRGCGKIMDMTAMMKRFRCLLIGKKQWLMKN